MPYCIKHYWLEDRADVRNDLLRFTIQYARKDTKVIEFAKTALNDRSKKVRRTALSIFAYSRDKNQLTFLKSIQLKGNEDDLVNAMRAIENQNHNLFYPAYNRWVVTANDIKRHLNKEEFKSEVNLYIEKYASEVVPELKRILGGELY